MPAVSFSVPQETLDRADFAMLKANEMCTAAMADPEIGGKGLEIGRARGVKAAQQWLDERRPKGYRSRSAFITQAIEHYVAHLELQLEGFKNAKR